MSRTLSVCLVAWALLCAAVASAQFEFGVEVYDADGSVVPIAGLQEVAIDDIVFDYKVLQSPREDTRENLAPAARQNWRLYGPGQPHWGTARFLYDAGASPELQAWFAECAKGKNIRKNITVTLFRKNGQSSRKYNLIDCFPTQWNSVASDPAGTGGIAELAVQMGEITFAEEGSAQNELPTGGVVVALDGLKDAWTQWGDGEPGLLIAGLVPESKFKTNSPGHKTVGEITLRGAMTDGRQGLCQWINDTVDGKPWKRMLTITELLSTDGSVKDGKQYIYYDCFPCRYVFPRMSVANTSGNTMEVVYVKPIRVELK